MPLQPFGVYEFNGNTTTETQAQVQGFFAYLKNYRAARSAAGKASADYLLFNGAPSALINTITSVADYRVGLYDWLLGSGVAPALGVAPQPSTVVTVTAATAPATGAALAAAPTVAVNAATAAATGAAPQPSVTTTGATNANAVTAAATGAAQVPRPP